jgi:DNA-binding beta-propeller fold protein YncE
MRGTGLVAALLSVALSPTFASAAKIYWADSGYILRADRDGGMDEVLVISGTSLSLAVDPLAGKMYGGMDQSLSRYDLDGSNGENIPLAYLGGGVNHIAVDPIRQKVYWNEGSRETLFRANYDGSGVEDLKSFDSPHGIALDLVNGKIYLGDIRGIHRGNIDGTGFELLFSEETNHPEDLAVDPIGGKVYWADERAHGIRRANLDLSGVENVISYPTGPVPHLAGIAVDPFEGKMYWTEDFDNVSLNRIRRANLDGSAVETLLDEDHGTIINDPTAIQVDVVVVPEAGTLAAATMMGSLVLRRRGRPGR